MRVLHGGRWQRRGVRVALALCLVGATGGAVWAQDALPPALVTVERGETAIALAQRLRPDGATLEQTLVALWRHNPRAFGNDNINHLLHGAQLRVPSERDILRIPARQAHSIALSHIENLQRYVRDNQRVGSANGAAGPAKTTLATAPTGAAGHTSSDALTQAIAQAHALKTLLEGQNKDTQTRLAQLEKNIQALHNLQAASPAALAASEAAVQAAAVPAIPATAVVDPVASAPTPTPAPGAAADASDAAAAVPPARDELAAAGEPADAPWPLSAWLLIGALVAALLGTWAKLARQTARVRREAQKAAAMPQSPITVDPVTGHIHPFALELSHINLNLDTRPAPHEPLHKGTPL